MARPVKDIDYRVTVESNKHSKKPTNVYVTAAQRKHLLKSLGETCFIVFSYYVEKARIKGFDFSDKRVAKALGYPERRVQSTRLTLTKAGWFYRDSFKNKHGQKVVVTFLGPVVVAEHKANRKRNIRLTVSDWGVDLE